MNMEHGFMWYQVIPLANKLPIHVFHALLILLLLLVFGWRIRRSINASADPMVPDTTFSARNIFEIVIEAVKGQLNSIIGHGGEKYLPLIGGIFIFIFLNNIIGIIPGFTPATSNTSTNIGMAVTVFLIYNYFGFKEHGIGYLKQFMGPLLALAPLMFLIEIVGHVFRPISLTVRLFGNMYGDHMVLAIFNGLTPLVVPVIFMILGILVSTIQAFVFAALSTVYIALAVSHDH